jgi:hypothetical protein
MLLRHGGEHQPLCSCRAVLLLHLLRQRGAKLRQLLQQRLVQEDEHGGGAGAAEKGAACQALCSRVRIQVLLGEHEEGWQAGELGQRGAPIVDLRGRRRARAASASNVRCMQSMQSKKFSMNSMRLTLDGGLLTHHALRVDVGRRHLVDAQAVVRRVGEDVGLHAS